MHAIPMASPFAPSMKFTALIITINHRTDPAIASSHGNSTIAPGQKPSTSARMSSSAMPSAITAINPSFTTGRSFRISSASPTSSTPSAPPPATSMGAGYPLCVISALVATASAAESATARPPAVGTGSF